MKKTLFNEAVKKTLNLINKGKRIRLKPLSFDSNNIKIKSPLGKWKLKGIYNIRKKSPYDVISNYERDFYKKQTSVPRVVNLAKMAKSGIWKLSLSDVVNIARKYNFYIPTDKTPIKHLSSTGIVMIRKGPGDYWLWKNPHFIRRKRRKSFKSFSQLPTLQTLF